MAACCTAAKLAVGEAGEEDWEGGWEGPTSASEDAARAVMFVVGVDGPVGNGAVERLTLIEKCLSCLSLS